MDKTNRGKALQTLWRKYWHDTRECKGQLLDACCTQTGISRKHAVVQVANYGQQR